jgi:hypothetical protein
MTQMLRKLLSAGVLLTDWEDCYLGEMSLDQRVPRLDLIHYGDLR